jgi:hypothetical protein
MTEIPGRADPTYDVLGDASGSPRDPTYDVGGGDATHGDDATYGDGATYDAGRDVKREGGDPAAIPDPAVDRDRRWRLALGADPDGERTDLTSDERAMDLALAALYDRGPRDPATDRPDSPDAPADRAPGLGASAPRVARWLGDIRTYFPSRVVQVMQSDAIERLGLRRLLLEPEMLASVEPDVHLVATLAALRGVIPEASKATAREVVRRVVDDVEARLADKLRQAVRGALHRAARTRRPRHADIDWARTVRANLQHYQPDYRTVVPERLVGYARRQSGFQRHVVLCVDQSGSMASSVVYASILACVLASIRAVRTSLVVYGTAVVDLTDQLADPVDVIFGTQLGRRNGHGPRAGLLRRAHHRSARLRARADQRPLRQQSRDDAGQAGRPARQRSLRGGAAGADGRGDAGVLHRGRPAPCRSGVAGVRLHAGCLPRTHRAGPQPWRCGGVGAARAGGRRARRLTPRWGSRMRPPPGLEAGSHAGVADSLGGRPVLDARPVTCGDASGRNGPVGGKARRARVREPSGCP